MTVGRSHVQDVESSLLTSRVTRIVGLEISLPSSLPSHQPEPSLAHPRHRVGRFERRILRHTRVVDCVRHSPSVRQQSRYSTSRALCWYKPVPRLPTQRMVPDPSRVLPTPAVSERRERIPRRAEETREEDRRAGASKCLGWVCTERRVGERGGGTRTGRRVGRGGSGSGSGHE